MTYRRGDDSNFANWPLPLLPTRTRNTNYDVTDLLLNSAKEKAAPTAHTLDQF